MNETRLPSACPYCGKMPVMYGNGTMYSLRCVSAHVAIVTGYHENPHLVTKEWNAVCQLRAWDAALERGDANFPLPENDGAHFVDSNDEN